MSCSDTEGASVCFWGSAGCTSNGSCPSGSSREEGAHRVFAEGVGEQLQEGQEAVLMSPTPGAS